MSGGSLLRLRKNLCGTLSSHRSRVRRLDVILEVLPQIVAVLGAEDSQAEEEQASGDEEAGGLMTITFASGRAEVLGDLNPENVQTKLGQIEWGGSTYIMPGWNLVVENYMEEFGDTPITERPHLLCLCITDGEAEDTEDFAKALSQAKGGIYICVAILGYGQAHDRALASTSRSRRTTITCGWSPSARPPMRARSLRVCCRSPSNDARTDGT